MSQQQPQRRRSKRTSLRQDTGDPQQIPKEDVSGEVEKVSDKRHSGEITKYKCNFCRADYTNQRELQQHTRLEHTVST
jgi:hypothetical protein